MKGEGDEISFTIYYGSPEDVESFPGVLELDHNSGEATFSHAEVASPGFWRAAAYNYQELADRRFYWAVYGWTVAVLAIIGAIYI